MGPYLCDRTNLAGSFDSWLHQGVVTGVTYYYSAFTYDTIMPPDYSLSVDRARARATLGNIVDVLDIRPNKLDLSKDSYIDIMVKLPEPGDINIEMFNIAGERIKKISAGTHQQFTYRWYGSVADSQENVSPKMAPGVYFVVFQNNKVSKAAKVFYIVK